MKPVVSQEKRAISHEERAFIHEKRVFIHAQPMAIHENAAGIYEETMLSQGITVQSHEDAEAGKRKPASADEL